MSDELSGEEIDRSPGYVNQLSRSINLLSDNLLAVGRSLEDAQAASERHAKSLTRATWALVLATVVLVIVTSIPLWRG
jgi:hypothetical protein